MPTAKEKVQPRSAVTPKEKPEPKIERKPEIDQFGEQQLQDMGVEMPFSEKLINTYLEYKKKKDKLHPGRLNPTDITTIYMLSEL